MGKEILLQLEEVEKQILWFQMIKKLAQFIASFIVITLKLGFDSSLRFEFDS